MNCRKCSAQIDEGSAFCTQCGEPVGFEGGSASNLHTAAQPVKKQGKRGKWILIISVCVLAAAAAVLIPVLMETARAAKYESAFALMEGDKAEEAKEGFLDLGEYKDSADMVQTCQKMIDYDEANDLMRAGDYKAAKGIFDSLTGYEKSVSLSAQCQNTLDYNDAVALMDAGDEGKAVDIFLSLGEYSDSADLAEECQKKLDYDSAKALMDAGDFEAAKSAFTSIISYKDSNSLFKSCQNEMDYIAADEAFSAGKFYTAYSIFSRLYSFKDAADRAEKCIQPNPKSGQTYRNPKYKAKHSTQIFKTPKDGYCTFLKIYDLKNDALVSAVFIASGKSVTVKLPKGKYYINAAYGKVWFGPEERFGDDGYYEDKMTFTYKGKKTSTLMLKAGWKYTMTLY